MEIAQATVEQLVKNPSEGLNVEIKRWIDPATDEGVAKIAIACLALRNRNGGFLIIGFDDETRQPDLANRPADPAATFHPDIIQGIVSKYAFTPFEVVVKFGLRDGVSYPVIAVDAGVTVPVAAKRELVAANKKRLIQQHGIYFRTLNSSGVPSSSLATANDWRDIVEICFENREADIGRFLRRHLGPLASNLFPDIEIPEASGVTGEKATSPSSILARLVVPDPKELLRKRVRAVLEDGERRKQSAFTTETKRPLAEKYVGLGAWSVAVAIDPPLESDDSDQEFFRTLSTANPQYTGWPVWLDANGFDKKDRPYKKDKGWETALLSDENWSGSHADFYRVHAHGEFYLWRVLQDDLTDKVKPKTVFDPGLMIYRVAETIAVALAFARALGANPNGAIACMFRWENMEGRELKSWADPLRYFSPWGETHDNLIEGYTVVPNDTPANSIAPYVKEATISLCSAFNGFEYPLQAIEQSVEKLINRRT
jgi:hypothetical protein|nr:hypothetical protein [Neorhizobium tomejilense]